jgi:drug/metabolite transporter (DMT)-like permease
MGFGIACMLGVVALWSIVPVLVKLLLPILDPFTIAFLRLSQGTAVVLVAYLLRGYRLTDIRLRWWHLIGGVGAGLNYALFALSLSFTTASAGVLVVQVQYVTLALLATVVLREKLGLGKVAGMALVLGGVGLIVVMRSDVTSLLAPRYVLGNVLMLFSGMGWGVYAVSNKVLLGRAGTLAALLPILVIGSGISGVLAATHFELRSAPTLGALAAMLVVGVVATGGAFILVSQGIKRLSAALAGTLTGVAPVTQILLAHFVLGEPLSWSLAGGGALILSGIFGMVLSERRR